MYSCLHSLAPSILSKALKQFPQGTPPSVLVREPSTLTILQVVLWALLVFPSAGGAPAKPSPSAISDPASQKPAARNPHGPLTIPCENCHTSAGWRPIKAAPEFDHGKTRYPLRGMHEKVACVQCHIKPVFTNVSKNCADCHADIHRRQMGPNCAQCHTVQGWNIAVQQVKDHQNRFPLLGAHAAVQCDQCHTQLATGIFYGLSTQCDSCHQKDWQNTVNPPHPASGPAFASANCQSCHNFDGWLGANFNHSITGWALTGAHATTPCALCHVKNNYNLTSANTDCYGCHQADWNSTQTLGGVVPNHVAASFPTSLCSTCHDTIAWADGKFDHSTTGWPLTGAHQMPPAPGSAIKGCTDCHVNNNYALTAANTACYGCHTADWNSTQTLGGLVPNHIAAGFPTTCDSCHNTVSWLNATFEHTYFPIPHYNSVCNDCHQVSANYSTFTCINCHTTPAHQQVPTTNQHAGVANFVYGPTTCYNCHKNGGAG